VEVDVLVVEFKVEDRRSSRGKPGRCIAIFLLLKAMVLMV
jgi:hypothetical protein